MENDTGFDLSGAIEHIPYEQKWEVFKPELEVLFHSQRKYVEIARFMKTKYDFNAQVSQYKYRFEKWKWKRSIPSLKKEQILDLAQQRRLNGKRTAAIFGTTDVDPKKLKRYIGSTQQKTLDLSNFNRPRDLQVDILGSYFPFGVRPFATWSIPRGALGFDAAASPSSPAAPLARTPSDVDVLTPQETGRSPSSQLLNAPSPMSSVLDSRALTTSTNFFLQGRFKDLLQSMNRSQMRTMSQWLYDYWLFAFRTAKYWGLEPSQNTPVDLEMVPSTEATTRYSLSLDQDQISPSSVATDVDVHRSHINIHTPSDLCRFSIHLDDDEFQFEDDDMTDVSQQECLPEHSVEQKLREALDRNDFSSTDTSLLPMDASQIAMAMTKSPQIVFEESLTFAIMAQNINVLKSLGSSKSAEEFSDALVSTHAMHVATSYLNGGKECCNILAYIVRRIDSDWRQAHVNVHGHTVLDNIMLTIMKNHSTTPIGRLDQSLRHGAGYTGIEVDICGRWDADTISFRSLLAAGKTAIPSHWKHKFCNTSVQAICHCIQILEHSFPARFGQPSGLFLGLCTGCGLKLQLTPLHTLIMIGFELANHACEGEDMFGIIACFLCLLFCGSNPRVTAQISKSLLFGSDITADVCDHQAMTVEELARILPAQATQPWSRELKIGWQLLIQICVRASLFDEDLEDTLSEVSMANRRDKESEEDVVVDSDAEEQEDDDKDDKNEERQISTESLPKYGLSECMSYRCDTMFFDIDPTLGHIWASVQAEFLNYRRLTKHDPWLSTNFNMEAILVSLEADQPPETGYMAQALLAPYCRCGHFNRCPFPLRQNVCKSYCSNMDCWERTSFIEHPLVYI